MRWSSINLAFGISLALVRFVTADDPLDGSRSPPREIGNTSCLAVACHGRYAAAAPGTANSYALTGAGSTWLRHDPHATAALAVRSPRYREIIDRLAAGQLQTAEARRQISQRC